MSEGHHQAHAGHGVRGSQRQGGRTALIVLQHRRHQLCPGHILEDFTRRLLASTVGTQPQPVGHSLPPGRSLCRKLTGGLLLRPALACSETSAAHRWTGCTSKAPLDRTRMAVKSGRSLALLVTGMPPPVVATADQMPLVPVTEFEVVGATQAPPYSHQPSVVYVHRFSCRPGQV